MNYGAKTMYEWILYEYFCLYEPPETYLMSQPSDQREPHPGILTLCPNLEAMDYAHAAQFETRL